jgi:hypothetical protein
MVKIDFIKIKLKYNKIRMTIIGIEDYQIKWLQHPGRTQQKRFPNLLSEAEETNDALVKDKEKSFEYNSHNLKLRSRTRPLEEPNPRFFPWWWSSRHCWMESKEMECETAYSRAGLFAKHPAGTTELLLKIWPDRRCYYSKSNVNDNVFIENSTWLTKFPEKIQHKRRSFY